MGLYFNGNMAFSQSHISRPSAVANFKRELTQFFEKVFKKVFNFIREKGFEFCSIERNHEAYGLYRNYRPVANVNLALLTTMNLSMHWLQQATQR